MNFNLKSSLLGLSLVPFLLGIYSEKSFSQENFLKEKKEYSYDVFFGFSSKDIGQAKGNNSNLVFSLGKIDELVFYKQENKYYEFSNSRIGKESFCYSLEDDLKLIHYDFESHKRKSKLEEKVSVEGQTYSKETLLVPEVFEIFEGEEIPENFKVLLFSKVYDFVLQNLNSDGEFVEAEYKAINYEVSPDDKKYLNGNPKIILAKEEDGTYYPYGARALIGYKILGIPLNFNIEVFPKFSKDKKMNPVFTSIIPSKK